MKIRLLSDLHHEFRPDTFTHQQFLKHSGEDVTVLAGDIAVGANNVAKVLDMFLLAGHRKIVYVPGNHEFYGNYYTEVMADLEIICHHRDVTLLRPGTKLVKDGVVFFGGTLWTNFGENPNIEDVCKISISDFRVIKGFKPAMCKALYYNDEAWIKRVYKQYPTHKKVIVTHFLPAMECVHHKYAGQALNKYFANDLGSWIETLDNTVWMYGHTHDAMNHKLGSTRLVCNPMGYPNEYNHFDPFMSIVV
jgi:predicted phosphodiesterase